MTRLSAMQGGWQPPPGGYAAPPPGYGPPGLPGPGFAPTRYGQGAYGSYEFNETENAVIDKTASRTKLWGWISTVLGALQMLGGTCGALASPTTLAYLPSGVVMLIVGITFIGVGNSLSNVTRTQGNDLMHMMTALQKLGNAFLIQTITFIIMVVLMIAAFFILFFVVFAVAATQH